MSKEATPTLSSAITDVFRVLLSEELHTSTTGVITAYDATERKATVQPEIKLQYLDDTELDIQPITDVPVVSFEVGNSGLKLPADQYVGQTCLLIFCERSLDTWLLKDGIQSPQDPRKFDITDAVAYVGLNRFIDKVESNNDLKLKANGTDISLKENGDIELNGGNKVIIKANGDIELGSTALRSLMTDAIITKFNTHTHAVAGAVTGPPPSAPVPTTYTAADATLSVKAQ